jgi:hypothetical protein
VTSGNEHTQRLWGLFVHLFATIPHRTRTRRRWNFAEIPGYPPSHPYRAIPDAGNLRQRRSDTCRHRRQFLDGQALARTVAVTAGIAGKTGNDVQMRMENRLPRSSPGIHKEVESLGLQIGTADRPRDTLGDHHHALRRLRRRADDVGRHWTAGTTSTCRDLRGAMSMNATTSSSR